MNGISSCVISLVHSLSDSSVSISVLFLVQLYSIRHRYDIFATSFRIRLSEKAQELGAPDPTRSAVSAALRRLCRILVQEHLCHERSSDRGEPDLTLRRDSHPPCYYPSPRESSVARRLYKAREIYPFRHCCNILLRARSYVNFSIR
jgi:hypothetical protein